MDDITVTFMQRRHFVTMKRSPGGYTVGVAEICRSDLFIFRVECSIELFHDRASMYSAHSDSHSKYVSHDDHSTVQGCRRAIAYVWHARNEGAQCGQDHCSASLQNSLGQGEQRHNALACKVTAVRNDSQCQTLTPSDPHLCSRCVGLPIQRMQPWLQAQEQTS